jgi:glycosyltransferase involved in cell wall biosynthesis
VISIVNKLEMKVVHISTEKTWRGGEQQIFYLHQELLRLGVQSMVITKRNSEISKRLSTSELPFLELPFRAAYDLQTAWIIKSHVNKKGVEVVHAHTSKAHTIATLAILLGMKAKVVVSRRVDVPVKNNWFSRFKYNHAKICRIVCVSEKIKEITATGVRDPSRLVTIHSGVDLERFKKITGGKLRKEFSIDLGYKIIGNVSALADHKDLPTFLQVASKLNRQNSKYLFVIVGEGEERTRLEQMITEMNLDKVVILTGFRSDIPEVLADIDLFLFTSKTEGLGTTVLDALASGTPVVATKAGGVPEILSKNKAGVLCEIGDVHDLSKQVVEILDDSQRYRSMISAGLLTAKSFSKQATAEKTFKLYQSIA